MKSLAYYFHIKVEILADFQICISVPLIWNKVVLALEEEAVVLVVVIIVVAK